MPRTGILFGMVEKETIIIKEKSDGQAVKVAAIAGLTLTSPFWMVLGICAIPFLFLIVFMFFATLYHSLPWILAAMLVVSLIPAVRSFITNKNEVIRLQQRVNDLEKELLDAKLHIHMLEEGASFDDMLQAGALSEKSAKLDAALQAQQDTK
ncbi:MAG TPA: hypothetical protein V6D17_18955 [Candidatus Obscuribacterales bacterium]